MNETIRAYGLFQKADRVAALMSADEIEYIICIFRNHYFRIYNSGIITAADENDRIFW